MGSYRINMNKGAETNVVKSIGWTVASKWSSKLIGMVNTIILARLLAPEDFGIVAMATIILAMLDAMTQVGVNLYIFRQKGDDPRLFNTAWTVNIIQGLVIALIVVLAAPAVAGFFGEAAVLNIIYCLAATKLIQGFQNVGVLIAQKQLKFHIDFYVTLTTRVSYLVVTLSLAIWLKSYWAIVFGQMTSVLIGVCSSYFFHSYRPKFQLYNWRPLYHYSLSTIPLSLGRYFNNNSDSAIVGKFTSAHFLGGYHVVSNLAGLFTKELLMPVIRGLIPNLSRLKDQADFDKTYRLTLALAVYAFLPIGIGLSMVSTELIHVLLGDQWLNFANILAWLSIYMMINGILMFASEQILVIMNKEYLSNRLMWYRNMVLFSTLGVIYYLDDYHQLPFALVVSTLFTLPIILWTIATVFKRSIGFFIVMWWPAIISCGLMAAVLYFVPFSDDIFPLLLLGLKIATGLVIYLVSVLGLFIIRGYPEHSPEALLISKAPLIKRLTILKKA